MRVTEALKLCGLVDTEYCTEHGMARGTAVHLACHLDDIGQLDESSVHDEVKPYLESWRGLRVNLPFEFIASEVEVENVECGYAGRLDRVLFYDEAIWIWDLKCGAPQPWHALQLALYALAYRADNQPTPRRAGVYLRADGKPAMVKRYNDRRDFVVAQACVTLAHWVKGE